MGKINRKQHYTDVRELVYFDNNTAQHHRTTTHLPLDLLHRLELYYGNQQTSRRNEIRVIA